MSGYGSGGSSRKKFVIKQFKQPQQVDKAQAARVWASLRAAIHQIHSQDASSLSFEELYRYAYNLVLHHHGDMLYDGVHEEVRQHLLGVATVVAACPDETLMQTLGAKWRLHKVTMVMIRDILMYMDRIYVVKKKKDKVYDFGLKLFRTVVLRQNSVRPRLRRLLLDNVRRERSGEVIDVGLMKATLGMLVELGATGSSGNNDGQKHQSSAGGSSSSYSTRYGSRGGRGSMGTTGGRSGRSSSRKADASAMPGGGDVTGSGHCSVYEEEFETPFLEETRAFYREEAQRFIEENTCPVYLQKAEARIEQERGRVADYLSPTTATPLRAIVEEHLIQDHADTLIEMKGSGLVAMLRDDKVADLQRMYRLFKGPGKLELVWKGMAAYVVSEGEALVTDTERSRVPVEFAKKLLAMRDKYDNIVRQAFQGDKIFQRALKNSFERFMNMDTRCAQFLALYVDDLLRHGIRGMRDEEIDATLDKVIIIFRYLTDKDVFEQFYKTHLQKRLLSGKSVSDDWERTMIAKLKTECGFQFTSKLEGMFADMRLSAELNDAFQRSPFAKAPLADIASPTSGATGGVGGDAQSGGGTASGAGGTFGSGGGFIGPVVDINVTVLTTGFWPAQKVAPCRLPPRVAACSERFKAFYLKQHSGRRLTWQTNRGHASVRAVFGGGKRHELNVTTYQMCILMLFNTADKLTFREVLDATSIPEADCRRHLVSLCTPRSRILLKSRKGKDVQPEDEFAFNDRFTSKMRRVKVPLISNKSSRGGSSAGHKSGAQGNAGDTGGTRSAGSGGTGKSGNNTVGGVSEAVEESRRHLVEAAIVRIMKTRKTLDNNNLVAEVTRQLSNRFRPTPQLIKKRIESLIEREYLERSEHDRRVYQYVA